MWDDPSRLVILSSIDPITLLSACPGPHSGPMDRGPLKQRARATAPGHWDINLPGWTAENGLSWQKPTRFVRAGETPNEPATYSCT